MIGVSNNCINCPESIHGSATNIIAPCAYRFTYPLNHKRRDIAYNMAINYHLAAIDYIKSVKVFDINEFKLKLLDIDCTIREEYKHPIYTEMTTFLYYSESNKELIAVNAINSLQAAKLVNDYTARTNKIIRDDYVLRTSIKSSNTLTAINI